MFAGLLAWALLAAPTPGGPPAWELAGSALLYLPPGDLYLQPTLAADRRWLHLEARYNYEDRQTGSAWVGYNLGFGKAVALELTPMLGGLLGPTRGLALGGHLRLGWRWLELYSEGEYVLPVGGRAESFLYNWSTLSLSPADWLRLGAAAQRTRAYRTAREVQRGLFLGLGEPGAAIAVYVFNPDLDQPTYVLGLELAR